MDTINSVELLKKTIIDLELKKIEQAKQIRQQFNTIKENLKPSNIIWNTVDEVRNSPKMKSNILGALIGLGAGYFTRKLVVGKTGNPYRRFFGNLIQVGLTAAMARRNDLFQTIGKTIIKRVFTKRNSFEHYRYN